MVSIIRHRNIPAPADRVWANMREFGAIHKFHPAVHDSRLLAGPEVGVGAERQCDFDPEGRKYILERQTAFDDEARRQEVEIYDGNFAPPARSIKAVLAVAETGEGTSRATMEMHVEGNVFQRLLATTVVRKKMGPLLEDILAGLEVHTLTGREVKGRADLQPAA